MVAVEGPLRQSDRRGEGVQLGQVDVAHEMAPATVTEGPEAVVDEQRHIGTLSRAITLWPLPTVQRRHDDDSARTGRQRAHAAAGYRRHMPRHDALLHARWRAATAAVCRCSATAADDALEIVLGRYREPHRRYHGVVHVSRVVAALHELTTAIASAEDDAGDDAGTVDLAPLVIAAVYHDAVYDPSSSSNEEDSARWAADQLRSLGADDRTIDRVRSAVLATARHLDPSTAPDLGIAVLLDADLAILGSGPSDYQSYVQGIRAEYAHLDDEQWRSGRCRVVDSLLDRDPLYHTAAGRSRWQARARANLTAERSRLASRSKGA